MLLFVYFANNIKFLIKKKSIISIICKVLLLSSSFNYCFLRPLITEDWIPALLLLFYLTESFQWVYEVSLMVLKVCWQLLNILWFIRDTNIIFQTWWEWDKVSPPWDTLHFDSIVTEVPEKELPAAGKWLCDKLQYTSNGHEPFGQIQQNLCYLEKL